jgi:hypothetical protein
MDRQDEANSRFSQYLRTLMRTGCLNKEFVVDISHLEINTNMLPRNVVHQSPVVGAPHPKRTESSVTHFSLDCGALQFWMSLFAPRYRRTSQTSYQPAALPCIRNVHQRRLLLEMSSSAAQSSLSLDFRNCRKRRKLKIISPLWKTMGALATWRWGFVKLQVEWDV